MASNAAIQQYINDSADPALAIYNTGTQNIPVVTGNTSVYITNLNAYTVNNIISGNAKPAGNTSEVQFNSAGAMEADSGLTYNPTTDSLTVLGNLTAGSVLTNNLKYANGTSWNFGGSYSNADVATYLPTYVGNLNPNIVSATLFAGSGANLTNIPGANVSGPVAYATVANSVAAANVSGTVSNATNATNATFAATVTTNAQPNITSVGTLNSVSASGTINFTTAGNVSLGAVGNIHITGGSTGQVLSTNGSGTLSWSTPTAGNLQDITTNGSTTDVAVQFTNTTDSTSYSTGAVKLSGGLGVAKTIHGGQHISAETTFYAGHLADFSSWTVPKFIGRDAGAYYIQGALVNTNQNGSADWVAYGDQSDDANGWMDMGFTGTAFNDPAYTITKENDGYIICQGMPTTGGNLVIATGSKGGVTHRDIVFATGGFLITDEKMRLNHEDSTLYVGAHGEAGGTNVTNLDVNGQVYLRNNVSITGHFTPTANVTYDLGNATHRFRDLYLSGTTINLGGTLIQAQANGEVSIGNATFTSSGTISAADVSLTVSALSANSVASLSDVGKMLTYDGLSPITYGIPNNATTAFATGSRIELLALSQASIIVQADGGSGVTLITSKDLNVNNPTISNIQSAKLTKIGTDTWYLGL